MSTRGRPPLPGPRDERGRRRDLPDARGDQMWHRAQDAAFKGLLDPRYASAIGRLELRRLLTRSQIEAGQLIERNITSWERLHCQHSDPSAPGYTRMITSDQPEDAAVSDLNPHLGDSAESTDAYDERVERRYKKLDAELDKLGVNGRAVIYALCVRHEDQSDAHLPSIRYALDAIGVAFDLRSAKGHVPYDVRITARRPIRRRRDDYSTRPDPLREAIGAETNAVRAGAGLPLLDEAQITELWDRIKARKDRTRLRGEKERMMKRR